MAGRTQTGIHVMRRILWTTIAAGLGCLAAAPGAWAAQAVECHANNRYHIAIEAHADDAPGARFAVTDLGRQKAPKACVFDKAKADFIIGDATEPLWFGQLAGKLLVLTRSTGQQGDLVVYDLTNRKKVLDVPSDEYVVGDSRLVFWQRLGQATAGNCPAFAENQKNGLGSVIAAEETLDLATLVVGKTGKSRCDAVQ
jgi:hypothetical protein